LVIIGIVGARIVAVSAIVRFVPVLSNPNARRVALKVVLVLTGLIIPTGAILVGFCFFGTLGLVPDASRLSPLHYVDGRAPLSGLTGVFGAIALFLLGINLTAPRHLHRDQPAQTFIRTRKDDVEATPATRHRIT
jgi:hypothetical protein